MIFGSNLYIEKEKEMTRDNLSNLSIFSFVGEEYTTLKILIKNLIGFLIETYIGFLVGYYLFNHLVICMIMLFLAMFYTAYAFDYKDKQISSDIATRKFSLIILIFVVGLTTGSIIFNYDNDNGIFKKTRINHQVERERV